MKRANALLVTTIVTCLAIVLAGRCLAWPFLWDDFDFLGRVQGLHLKDFLPQRDLALYRPLSREGFFSLVTILGRSPLVAHVLTTMTAGVTIFLLIEVVASLSNRRAGILSGIVFATGAGLPLAMGWVSGIQDLLCACFAMFALYLQLRGRVLPAALAMAAALLSKETALALVPVLCVIAYGRSGGGKAEVARTSVACLLLLAIWAAIHPWPAFLYTPDGVLASAPARHLSLRGLRAIPSALNGLAMTLNVPLDLRGIHLPTQDFLLPFAASIALIAGIRSEAWRSVTASPANPVFNRTLLLAGTLALAGPISMTSLVVDHWSPYYACIPSIGLGMLLAPVLGRLRAPLQVLALLAFLWLGVILRHTTTDPQTPEEPNFHETASALNAVEMGFKQLHPVMPLRANVYVSIQERGHGGLYGHLFRFQPLRIWYDRPGIWVLDPNSHRADGAQEFLFWITPRLEVFEINPITLEPRGPSSQVNLGQYQKTLRGYSFGLASAGNVERAVQILTSMTEPSQEVKIFDTRTAAMLLFATGNEAEAGRLLEGTPSFDHATSLEAAEAVLVEPTAGLNLDAAAMRAFALDPNDPETLHALAKRLDSLGSRAAARRFASMALALNPSDSTAIELIRRNAELPTQQLTKPIPHQMPQ